MLYNYYMKKFMSGFLTAFFSLLSVSLFAQITIVRVEGSQVFMDISSAQQPIQKGNSFKVILSEEKITNPQTGKELGVHYNYSSEGKIIEVQPLFAVGQLSATSAVKVGQEVVLQETTSTVDTNEKQEGTKNIPQNSHQIIRYNPIQQTIISVNEIALPDNTNAFVTLGEDNAIIVWKRGENKNLEKVLSYQLPVGKKAITLSVKDIAATGTPQLFVPVYDQARQTISTLVLAVKNNQLVQIDTLPYFVKELGCGSQKTLWGQKPFVTFNRPGNAKNIIYQKGKFSAGKESFSTQHNWLLGLNFYPVQNEKYNNLIYTSSNGKIRMILENGKRTESADDFAATPNRIAYKQEIIRFYPSLQVFGPANDMQIAAVENISKLGILSNTFGQYQNGKIHWIRFEQGRLKTQEITPLDGVIYDTACTNEALLTAEVLTDGTSSVVEILK